MSNENKTLVILTPGWAQSEADTNCLPMLQSFARTLRRNHPQLNIIILAFQYPYFKKTYKWFGVTVISFNGKNKGGLARLGRMREINATLKKIGNHNQVNGILSFWAGECAAVGKRFADKNGLRHYCWILGQDARKENKYPGRIHAAAGELVALSDFLQDEFEKNHGVRPSHVIPPGIHALPATEAERDIDILGAGSLIPLKRLDLFIEMIAEIKKEFPALKAMLVGDGPEKEKLQFLVDKNALQQNIILTGELPHPELLKLMQRSKLLLHPSSYEGFSGVCQEALAAGAHVISFCRAMKQDIDHWHIVKTREEMKERSLVLLQETDLSHKPVLPFPMTGTAQKIMELLGSGT